MYVYKNGKKFDWVETEKQFELLRKQLLKDKDINSADQLTIDLVTHYREIVASQKPTREKAISWLTIKAIDNGMGDLFSKIMNTNSMQMIISQWEYTGDTEQAITSIRGISGRVSEVLNRKVGTKGLTIADHIILTMQHYS